MGWTGIWWGVILTVGWASLKGFIAAAGLWRKIILAVRPGVPHPLRRRRRGRPGADPVPGGGLAGALLLVGTAIVLGIINVIFYQLLRAPTEMGQKLLDQIEGFRLYLSTAEEDRLKVLHPPEKTPELFERYLPYALALDCENEWNAKFAAVLAAAAVAGATAPAWYSGRHWDSGRTRRLHRQPGAQPAVECRLGLDSAGQQLRLGRRRILRRRRRRRRRSGW